MRSSTADVFETLARPLELDLEQAMEFCADDECVEVTPEIVRVRKVELDATPAGPRPRRGPSRRRTGLSACASPRGRAGAVWDQQPLPIP